MRAVDIGLFEHLFEELIDEVAGRANLLAITKDDEPIAELAPFAPVRQSLWGAHKGQIEILGDIVAPVDVEWDADR
jgi:antitoxin (DNA-binding transcriptional repressor) of toxin-antitoxin stability system